MIYSKIYDFCKVRNAGSFFLNGPEPTPRVKFICDLLTQLQIPYEVDRFEDELEPGIFLYNVILKGTSPHWVVAHHDIFNPNSENANDNSCSIINAIALKKQKPDVNVCFTDGEEFGGIGAQRLSDQLLSGELGNFDWILNLELTGLGGENFFIGKYPGPLQSKIIRLFNPPITHTPFNDSVIFRKNGIDSCVINPLPEIQTQQFEVEEETKENDKEQEEIFDFDTLEFTYYPKNPRHSFKPYKPLNNILETPEGKQLDKSILWRCHSMEDNVQKISVEDMENFVEKILIPIVT
jgi:hypothetical protein